MGRRRSKCCEFTHRPHQRRAVVRSRCGSPAPTETALKRGARGAGRRSAAGSRAAEDALVRAADRDGCVAGRLLLDDQPSGRFVRHGGRWLEVERQRMDAVDRDREAAARLPQAARDPRRRRGRLRHRGHQGRAGVPGARPPRLRVHDERDLVRAARRGRRVAHCGDDARRQARRRPDRVRRRTGRRAHRRRRRTSAI